MSQKDNDVEASIPLTVSSSGLAQDAELTNRLCLEHLMSIGI